MKEREILKLYNSITNVDNRFIEETRTKTRKKNRWFKWGAVVACVCFVIFAFAIPRLYEQPNDSTSGDLSPMIYVNNTLYRITGSQPDLTGKESQFVYLGIISSKVRSSQYPQENFQANDDIVGSAVYQFGEDIVVEIDGQYWSYCAVLDVGSTAHNDGTSVCESHG